MASKSVAEASYSRAHAGQAHAGQAHAGVVSLSPHSHSRDVVWARLEGGWAPGCIVHRTGLEALHRLAERCECHFRLEFVDRKSKTGDAKCTKQWQREPGAPATPATPARRCDSPNGVHGRFADVRQFVALKAELPKCSMADTNMKGWEVSAAMALTSIRLCGRV
jgi:hypothetical protein